MEGMTEMTARRKVTIRQVAEQAGVSVGTVSNYLNGKTAVSRLKSTCFLSVAKVRNKW